MMYYATLVHDATVINVGETDTYTEATEILAARLAAAPVSDYWTPKVLLDTSSFDMTKLAELMLHDPALTSVFQYGMVEGWHRAKGLQDVEDGITAALPPGYRAMAREFTTGVPLKPVVPLESWGIPGLTDEEYDRFQAALEEG